MAGFATDRSPVCPRLPHAVIELPFVRVFVASRACQVAPVVKNSGLGLEVRVLLVAIAASDRDMTSREHKARFLVPGQREGGRFVSLQIMAARAVIEVWRLCELFGMLIAVAISTVLELHLEQSVLALGDVALRALQFGVASLQGIGRSGVVLHSKFRWLEAIHGMAGGALDSAGPFRELTVVRIRLMAIHALLEGQRLLEIASGVAQCAFNRGMLSQQGILGLGMVKALVNRHRRDFFPAGGVVA